MNLEQAVENPVQPSFALEDACMSTNPKAVLKDLFELLEEYGPTWYTEELHIRARIALSRFQ